MHGPLLAILLLEFAGLQESLFGGFDNFMTAGSVFESFEYSAFNPLVVNRSITFKFAWVGDKEMRVWAEDSEDGTVGMVGAVHLISSLTRHQRERFKSFASSR